MMVEPESYEGKTVRMQGELVSYPHPFTGEDCHAVIVKDALACCAQGFQFQPTEGVTLPADGAEVTVTGVYTLDESLMDQGIIWQNVPWNSRNKKTQRNILCVFCVLYRDLGVSSGRAPRESHRYRTTPGPGC